MLETSRLLWTYLKAATRRTVSRNTQQRDVGWGLPLQSGDDDDDDDVAGGGAIHAPESRGGKINMLHENSDFLRSTDLKLLSQMPENSINNCKFV